MINYPVDTENTRWVFYNIDTHAVEREGAAWPNRSGTEIIGQPTHIVPLLVVETPEPAHDPATQKVVAADWIVDVGANTYTQAWSVANLTAEEIAELVQSKAMEIYAERARRIEALASPWSPIEARIWPELAKQARAYQDTGEVGDLIQAAVNRGRDPVEYCASVIQHADYMEPREQAIIAASEQMLADPSTYKGSDDPRWPNE